jgi:plastocyanin
VRRTTVAGLVLALILAGGNAPSTPAFGAVRTWTVVVGGTTRDFSVWSNAFYPRKIEIAIGDTVIWKFAGVHKVALLGGEKFPALFVSEGDRLSFNPLVAFPAGGTTYDGTGYHNSGMSPDNPALFVKYTYALTFTKAGTYDYVCVVHGPGMGGTVEVQDRVSGAPASAAAQGGRDQAATLRAGTAALAAWKPTSQGSTVVAPMVGSIALGYSLLRFSRLPLTVTRGATVTWTMQDPFEIHTVTFTSGQKPPDFVLVQPQPKGPPKLMLNPKAVAVTPQKTYDGKGYVNSGLLYSTSTPGNVPRSYSLTFTTPGRYEYWCIVHVPEGMKGVIIVR